MVEPLPKNNQYVEKVYSVETLKEEDDTEFFYNKEFVDKCKDISKYLN